MSTAIARATTNRVNSALKIASKSVISEPLLVDFACLNECPVLYTFWGSQGSSIMTMSAALAE